MLLIRKNAGFVAVTLGCAVALLSGCSSEKDTEKGSSGTNSEPAVPLSGYTLNLNSGQDQVVVEVGGKVLMRADLDRRIEEMLRVRNVPPQYHASVRPRFEQEYVGAFVVRHVRLAEASKRGVTVTEEELTQAIEMSKKHLPPDTKIEDILAQQNMTMDDLRKTFREEVQVRKMLSDIAKSVPQVSDEIVKKHYDMTKNTPEKVRARHILVKCSPTAPMADKQAKMKAIESARKRVLDGEDFAKVAKEVSECGSANRGGDLGMFGRGQMVPPFEKAAFAQELNQVGPVVQTQHGYHFLEVTERAMQAVEPFEDVKDKIAAQLMADARNSAVRVFTESLLQNANVNAPGMPQQPPQPAPAPQPVVTPTRVITAAPPR